MEFDYYEKCCECALNDIFGYEPRAALALMRYLGSAKAVFELSSDDLTSILGPFSKHKNEINGAAVEKCDARLQRLSRGPHHFVCMADPAYPALLRECEDAPVGLYVKSLSSPQEIFGRHRYVSVVGTRDLSSYGKSWCREFVSALGSLKGDDAPTVVSGLALGVDITAHTAALDAGLPTIAVMATGIDKVYPFQHGFQAERIVRSSASALVTDYPPGTSPVAINFLRRNRIIAGLSQSTVLVESKIKGGGMVTASLAESYGRDLFALPGRCDDIRSKGCNHLIAVKSAEAIEDIPSLIAELGLENGGAVTRKSDIITIAGERYRSAGESEGDIGTLTEVLSLIRSNRDISIDEIFERCDFESYGKAAETVTRLEVDGFVEVDLLRQCSICSKNM